MKALPILVDQDGVLADFDQRFFELAENNPALRGVLTHEDRRQFSIKAEYPLELQSEVCSIYQSAGFFLSLKPIESGIEAVKELTSLGHRVVICTTPLTWYQHCVLEKYQWVDRYMGADFVSRMVLTKDKTIIRGSYLIDDKPEITGVFEEDPEWEHIIFNAPYNQTTVGKRRILSDWSNWREILLSD